MWQILVVIRHRNSRDSLTSQTIGFSSRSAAEEARDNIRNTYSHHSVLETTITTLY